MVDTKRDWVPIFVTVGVSIFTGIITAVIAVTTMSGDIKVLAKDIEGIKTQMTSTNQEVTEIRQLHYKIAAKQVEQEQNIKGVATAINPVLLASKAKPVVIPVSKIRVDISQLAVDLKKKN